MEIVVGELLYTTIQSPDLLLKGPYALLRCSVCYEMACMWTTCEHGDDVDSSLIRAAGLGGEGKSESQVASGGEFYLEDFLDRD